jgi:hypothetical protein
MSNLILLGAGASRGTLKEQAPVAAEFGQCLNHQVSDWDTTYPYLAAVVRFLEPRVPNTSKESWALDKVWGAIDNRVKLRYILDLSLPGAPFPPPRTKRIYNQLRDPWGLAGFELRCALTRIYGVRLTLAIREAVKGSGTLKGELARLQAGDCVISFNYDLLAEKLLKAVNKCVVRSGHLETANTKDAVLLCKPHGCLSWKQRVPENGRVVRILDRPMTEEDVDFDPVEKATVQPGIVGPVPFKSEIIVPELQEGNVDDFFRLLVSQWRDAIQRISQAERLIVLGYGFPSEDLHAQYLFAEAAAKIENNKRLQVEVFEREGRFEEVRKEICKLFKPASCEYQGPVEP